MPEYAESAYLFRHALMRDAAYNLQPPGDRAVLHALVVEIVESIVDQGDPLLDSWAAELADHALAAQAFRRTANLKLLRSLADTEVKYLLRALKHEAAEFHNERAIAFGIRIGDHPAASLGDRFAGMVQAGEILMNIGEVRRARGLFERALALARQDGNERDEGRALRAVGISYARMEGPPQAIPWLEQALAIFRRLGDKTGIGMALSSLALIRAGSAPPDETLAAYGQALGLLTESGHINGQAATNNNMGNLLRHLGRYEEAERCLRRAVELHRGNNERHMEGLVMDNLGALLGDMGRRDEADEANRQAIRMARETGSRAREGVALLHRAIRDFEEGRLQQAEHLFAQALDAAEEAGDRYWQGVALMNQAVVYESASALDRALQTGLRARGIFEAMNARNELGIVIANLGGLAVLRADLGGARVLYEQALPMLAASGNRVLEGIHRGGYAVVLKKLGAPAEQEMASARSILAGQESELKKLEQRWSEAEC